MEPSEESSIQELAGKMLERAIGWVSSGWRLPILVLLVGHFMISAGPRPVPPADAGFRSWPAEEQRWATERRKKSRDEMKTRTGMVTDEFWRESIARIHKKRFSQSTGLQEYVDYVVQLEFPSSKKANPMVDSELLELAREHVEQDQTFVGQASESGGFSAEMLDQFYANQNSQLLELEIIQAKLQERYHRGFSLPEVTVPQEVQQ